MTDRGFASPVVDAEAEAAKTKKEALEKEIERVKQEYEEKQRKKKGKKKDDDKEKKKDAEDDDKAEKERDDKVSVSMHIGPRFADRVQIKALQSGANAGDKATDIPRVHALHK